MTFDNAPRKVAFTGIASNTNATIRVPKMSILQKRDSSDKEKQVFNLHENIYSHEPIATTGINEFA